MPLKRIHAAVTMRGAGLVQLMLAAGFAETPPADMFETPVKGGLALEKRYRLKRPKGKRLEDSFYRDVAHAYQSALAFGLQPRKAMVADTGAADATVAAWVLEARRRGYLAKVTPGSYLSPQHVTIEPAVERDAAKPLTASKRRRKE